MSRPSELVSKQEGEGRVLRNNYQITIQIEYCTNCETHALQNRHSSLKYKCEYEELKKKLQQHGIIVRKKQMPKNLYKKSPYCPPNLYCNMDTNQQVCFPALGSFQVYYNNKKIFSKISNKHFPNPDNLLALIYKLSLKNNNFYFHDKGFLGKKKNSHKQAVIQSIIQNQQQFFSIDFQKLESQKRKYEQLKQRIEKKRRILSRYQQQVRPNTTSLATNQTGNRQLTRRPFYSRGHQKTNEEVLNSAYKQFQASIKIRKVVNILANSKHPTQDEPERDKSPHFIRYPPKKGNSKLDEYSVYLESLKPSKKCKDPELQSHRTRLRRKIEEYRGRFKGQVKDIKEIDLVKNISGESKLQQEQKLIFAELLQNMQC